MSYSRFVVATRHGDPIAEIEPDIASISWRLNKVGKCTFSLAKTDSKAIKDNLRLGNRVLIEFENGLPSWAGIIEPPRSWDSGIIRNTAMSAEYLFKYRTTGKDKYFSGATVGAIYQELITNANAIEDMGIEIGSVWPGGISHSPDYHYKSLLDIFQNSLAKRMGSIDFDVTGNDAGGQLNFYSNLYERKGSDKPNIALIQGKNISSIKLKEQGPIINSWFIAGQGASWGDERLTATAQDTGSIAEYGLRENSEVKGDTKYQTTLDENASNLLAETKDPYNIFTLKVADEDPAKFADYSVGDALSLIAPDYGFDGIDTTVRILTREYYPAEGFCSLVVQEVL